MQRGIAMMDIAITIRKLHVKETVRRPPHSHGKPENSFIITEQTERKRVP